MKRRIARTITPFLCAMQRTATQTGLRIELVGKCRTESARALVRSSLLTGRRLKSFEKSAVSQTREIVEDPLPNNAR